MVKKLTISESDDETVATDNESIKEEEIKKPVKPKKKLSEKQLETLKKGREARKSNIEESKLNKKIEASKLLLEVEHKNKKKEVKKEVKQESEDDEEVVIIEKQRKPKKKVKKIIIQESESSSEEEEEIVIPEKKMKSQKNKKSIVKDEDVKQLPDPSFDKPKKINNFKNYFV
jgi:hypothetical protein